MSLLSGYSTTKYIWLRPQVWKMKSVAFSWLGIPEILMNIMTCYGFSKVKTSTVILTCCTSLVPYYFSKVFIIDGKLQGFFNIYQNQFSRKLMIIHYMMTTDFWHVNQQYHKLLKHWTNILLQNIHTTNFCLVSMMKDMLNPLLKSFMFLSNKALTNLNIQPSSMNGFTIWAHLLICNNH